MAGKDAQGVPSQADFVSISVSGDIDSTSDLRSKPFPEAGSQNVAKAIGKITPVRADMKGAPMQEAAGAHVKAIEGMDAKSALSQLCI